MKAIWVIALTFVFVAAALGQGQPPVRQKMQEIKDGMLPYTSYVQYETLAGEKFASVIASGGGKSYFGLYIDDQHGNCVAHDDFNAVRVPDDAARKWYVQQTSKYLIELRNPLAARNDMKYMIQ